MPDLNRINYLSLFCSCVGHAAIVGGILYGLSDFREERVGLKRSTQPLVVELIPIDHMSDAKTGGAAPNHDEAPAVVPRQGTAPLSRPTKSLAEPIRLVSKPGDAVGTMLAPEGAGEHGSTTARTSANISAASMRLLRAAVAIRRKRVACIWRASPSWPLGSIAPAPSSRAGSRKAPVPNCSTMRRSRP